MYSRTLFVTDVHDDKIARTDSSVVIRTSNTLMPSMPTA